MSSLLLSRPISPAVLSVGAESARRRRRTAKDREKSPVKEEVSMFPEFRGQRNWRYSIVDRPGKGSILRIGTGNRYYAWELDGEVGTEALKAKRLSDLDKTQILEIPKGSRILGKGTFQLHRSTRDLLHGTMQDGKRNLSIQIARDGDGWTVTRRRSPRRPDGGRVIYEAATKTAAGEMLGLDKAMYPLYTPPGGSHLTRLGLAAGIGALGGLAYHGVDRATAWGDEALGGQRRRPQSGLLARMLKGALVGAGTSAVVDPVLRHLGDPVPVPPPASPVLPGTAPSGGDFTGNVLVDPDRLVRSRKTAFVHDPLSYQMSNRTLKTLVFGEPTIPFGVKREMFREIDAATDNPRMAVSPMDLIGMGVGGMAGYMAAKASGRGPVSVGLAAGIGTMVARHLQGGAVRPPVRRY